VMHLLHCHMTDRVAADMALEGCSQKTIPIIVCTSPFLKSASQC